MKKKKLGHEEFLLEMVEYNTSVREFFGNDLLDSLERNFKFHKVVIYYFDTEGHFLSWITNRTLDLDREGHAYREFMANDVIRHMIFQDAMREKLTYFDVIPRLYKATDIIGEKDYDQSAYVRCLEENFGAHYSVTMAFGINAYIQVGFFQSKEEGDFTEAQMEELEQLYVYIANAYKNFKKHEQVKIISNIQSEIISSGERAYLIVDDFFHIINCNSKAKEYLQKMTGYELDESDDNKRGYNWLSFLMWGNSSYRGKGERVYKHEVKGYVIQTHCYEQEYSNGIIDRYHWITIGKNEHGEREEIGDICLPLTNTEHKVAMLLYQGLTYKEVASQLMVSYHTVKKHVQNIYTKSGVNNRFQLHEWIDKYKKK